MATELENQLKGQVSASDKKVDALTKQVDELVAQQNKLDPDEATHADLVTKVNELSGELSKVQREHADSLSQLETEQTARKDAETTASEANAKVDETQKNTDAAEATQEGTKVVDGWMKDFDSLYGAEHHNAALEAAQAKWEKHDASKLDENDQFIATAKSREVIIKSLLQAEYVLLRDAKVASNAKVTGEPSLSAPSAAGNAEVKTKTWEELPVGTGKQHRQEMQAHFRRQEAEAAGKT